MRNPNPIPDVGSRWLKNQKLRGVVEVEVLASDARDHAGHRLITYREVASEYVNTILFMAWRKPSVVTPVPSAPTLTAPVATQPIAPTVGAPRADRSPKQIAHAHPGHGSPPVAVTSAPPCKVCGKPCGRRGGTHGNPYRATCSDACLAIRKNEVARMATSAAMASASERRANRAATVTSATTPRALDATGLRAALRSGWLAIFLPADVKSAFQARCIADACTAQDAVTTALLAWLTSPT